jgi:hypothetical protein
MATVTFSTWEDLRTAIKNAIANQVAGKAAAGEYEFHGIRMKYRTFEELTKLLDKTYELEALEATGSSARVSYGRYRRW